MRNLLKQYWHFLLSVGIIAATMLIVFANAGAIAVFSAIVIASALHAIRILIFVKRVSLIGAEDETEAKKIIENAQGTPADKLASELASFQIEKQARQELS